MVLLDGLYANGPVMELCRKHKWEFMIVLKDACISSLWEKFEGLKGLSQQSSNRKQHFQWVNDIEYYYDASEKKKQIVHVVVCEENWEEVAKDAAKIVTKKGRHAWISSEPLDKWNIHDRCNLGARHRWGIESGFLVEKRHGYQYEHCFSYNWNAMKGYHYLMRLGHMFNVLAHYSERLVSMVREMGVRGLIRFIRETISGPWLDAVWVNKRLEAPFQLCLV